MNKSDKKLIAFFTILPPAFSGIAVYSLAVINELRKDYDVHVFTNKRNCDCDNHIHSHFCFTSMKNKYNYEVIIYQIGNHEFFNFIYAYIAYNPGILVLHDIHLYQSRAKYLIANNKQGEYIEEMYYCHGYTGKKFAEISLKLPIPKLFGFVFPMNKLVIDCSVAVGVHTKFYQEQLSFFYPNKSIYYIPISLGSIMEYKRAEGIAVKKESDEILIGSAGYIDEHKGILNILKAINNLRKEFPIKYIWIGEDKNNLISSLISQHFSEQEQRILNECIQVTGFLSDEELINIMGQLDIFINLRYPTAGEFSGVLWLAMHFGRAIIMSDLPHLMEIPCDCVYKINLENELENLIKGLRTLIKEPAKRMQLGSAAKKYASENYTIDNTIKTYKLMIEDFEKVKKLHKPQDRMPQHFSRVEVEKILRDIYIKLLQLLKNECSSFF